MPRIRINQFHNGWSNYETQGYPGQFLKSLGINIRGQLGNLSLNYGTTPVTHNTANVYNPTILCPYNSNVYAYDPTTNNGTLFQYTPGSGYNAVVNNATNPTFITSLATDVWQINGRIYYCYQISGNYNIAYYPGIANLTTNIGGGVTCHHLKNGRMWLGVGNMVMSIDGSNTFNGSELTLPTGYTIIDIDEWQEYVVFLCRKSDGTGSAVYWAQDSTTSWDFEVPIPAYPWILWNTDGDVRVLAGGNLTVYKVERTYSIAHANPENIIAPWLQPGDTGIQGPNQQQKTIYGNYIHFAIPKSSDTRLPMAVYSYGTRDPQTPPALNGEYAISTGTISGSGGGQIYAIAPLLGQQSDVYIAWSDPSQAGGGVTPQTSMDHLSNSYATNYNPFYESLIFDAGQPEADKIFNYIGLNVKPLTGSASVVVKYKLDDNASWTTVNLQKATLASSAPANTILLEYPFTSGLKGKRLQLRLEWPTGNNANMYLTTITFGYELAQSRV